MALRRASQNDKKLNIDTYNGMIDAINSQDSSEFIQQGGFAITDDAIKRTSWQVIPLGGSRVQVVLGDAFAGEGQAQLNFPTSGNLYDCNYIAECIYGYDNARQASRIPYVTGKYNLEDDTLFGGNTTKALGKRDVYIVVTYYEQNNISTIGCTNPYGKPNFGFIYSTNAKLQAGLLTDADLLSDENRKINNTIRRQNIPIAKLSVDSNDNIVSVVQLQTGAIHFPTNLQDSENAAIIQCIKNTCTNQYTSGYAAISSSYEWRRSTLSESPEKITCGVNGLTNVERVPKDSLIAPYFESSLDYEDVCLGGDVIGGELKWAAYDQHFCETTYTGFSSNYYQNTLEVTDTTINNHSDGADKEKTVQFSNLGSLSASDQVKTYNAPILRTGCSSTITGNLKNELCYASYDTYISHKYTAPIGNVGADVIGVTVCGRNASVGIYDDVNCNKIVSLYDFPTPTDELVVCDSDYFLLRKDVGDGSQDAHLAYVTLDTMACCICACIEGGGAVGCYDSHHALVDFIPACQTKGCGWNDYDDHGSTRSLTGAEVLGGAYISMLTGNAGGCTAAQMFARNDGTNYFGGANCIETELKLHNTTYEYGIINCGVSELKPKTSALIKSGGTVSVCSATSSLFQTGTYNCSIATGNHRICSSANIHQKSTTSSIYTTDGFMRIETAANQPTCFHGTTGSDLIFLGYDTNTINSCVALTGLYKGLCIEQGWVVGESTCEAPIIITAACCLTTEKNIFADTTACVFNVTLPANPVDGKGFRIVNTGSSANNLTICNNTRELLGATSTFDLLDGDVLQLIYSSTTCAWW